MTINTDKNFYTFSCTVKSVVILVYGNCTHAADVVDITEYWKCWNILEYACDICIKCFNELTFQGSLPTESLMSFFVHIHVEAIDATEFWLCDI